MTRQPVDCPGSAPVNRYFDPASGRFAVKLLPGQFHVSVDEVIVTVIGSCVAVCLRDPEAGIGGMNHFLDPVAGGWTAAEPGLESRYGFEAMRSLLDGVLDAGARMAALEANLFGAACMLDERCELGARTLATARAFLMDAEIPVVFEDVGGAFPRKLYYLPEDGRVRIKRLRDIRNDTILDRDKQFLAEFASASNHRS